jgi:hypothetical protein
MKATRFESLLLLQRLTDLLQMVWAEVSRAA